MTDTVSPRSWFGTDRPTMSTFVGAVLVFGAGVAFSFGGLVYRLTDDVDPWRYIIFRGLGAVIATSVILALRYRGRLGELVGSVEPSHLLAGLLLGSMAILFIVSLAHASVAFVLFLQALAPVAAAVFSRVLLGERMSRAAVIATAVSIVGVISWSRGRSVTGSVRSVCSPSPCRSVSACMRHWFGVPAAWTLKCPCCSARSR